MRRPSAERSGPTPWTWGRSRATSGCSPPAPAPVSRRPVFRPASPARAEPGHRHRAGAADRLRRRGAARQGSGGEKRHGAAAGARQGLAHRRGARPRARPAGHDRAGRAGRAEAGQEGEEAVVERRAVGGAHSQEGARMSWIVAGLVAGVGAFFADYVMWGKVFTGPEMRAFGTMPPTPE